MSDTNTPVAVGGKRNNAQGYVLERIAAIAKQRLHKNAQGWMNETINPLWNIDERKASMIYNWARSGNYAQIQYLYNDIENKDPTLGVCVTRRTSAVAELDWRVVRSDQRRNRGVDQKLIDEQIECIETAIAKIDNMPDALEHLALSSFRGFSAVAPVLSIHGGIERLDLIDGWNLCYDRAGQSWLFNPSATSFFLPTNYTMATENDWNSYSKLDRIPKEAICVVTRKREIDWPAMQIFLRCSVGERDWGRFLETYGLPPVIITMPEFTSKEDQEAYVSAAEAVFEGRSGVVPHGSDISFASESRGTNPFTEFIEHQQKLIVMMATGGTLATLAESGSGTLAGDAQQDEWKRIIRADKRIISNAINKQICEPILRAQFKGKPILAEFQLDDTPKPTPKEMLELAGAAASAGFEMDVEELSQAIGYKLTKKVEGGGMGFDMPPTPSTPTVTIPGGSDDDADDTDPNAGKVTEPVATNVEKDNTLDEETIDRYLASEGFRDHCQVGRFGSQWIRKGDYAFTDGGESGKCLVVYERKGYWEFVACPLDFSVTKPKVSKRCRTVEEMKSAVAMYRSLNVPFVATNVDEGLADDAEVEPLITNASGGAIVSRMKRAIADDEKTGLHKADKVWQKLSVGDMDEAIKWVIMHLPPSQYNKGQVGKIIRDDLGLSAAVRFDNLWSQYFWSIADRHGDKYATSQTGGLQCFTVKNKEVAANPPKTPSTPVAPSKPTNEPPAKQTPSTPVSAPITREDNIAQKSLVEMAKAVQTDFKPVADRIAEILALPEEERAGAAVTLMQDLDRLVPEDGDIAEVIRAEMQKAFDGNLKAETK